MIASDRIEKRVVLRAPVSRVWRAISRAEEFARWFGVKLEGEFAVGRSIMGTFEAKIDEAAIVDYQKQIGVTPSKVRMPVGNVVFCTVERIDPEHYFSFRWIPYGIDAEAMRRFVASLDLPEDARARLAALTPAGYTGLAERLARDI